MHSTAVLRPPYGPQALRRLALVLFAGLALLVSAVAPSAAFAQDAEPPGPDNPPIITGGSVSPSSLGWEGGQVDITATVIDDYGLSMVYATLYGPDSTPYPVQLIQSGDNQFSGSVAAPPNTEKDARQYGIEVSATDWASGTDTKIIGYVEIEGSPVFDEDPYLWGATVTPRDVPATGGAIEIGVNASDDHGVNVVLASIEVEGYTFPPTWIELTADSATHYTGTFTVPANTTPNDKPYRVKILVADDVGQEVTLDAGLFTVRGTPTQPAGLLTLSPTWSVFGPIRVGAKTRALFTVRNPGKVGGPTLAASAVVSGAGFSLVGVNGAAQPLSLEPGKSAQVLVQYAPTRSGLRNGKLTITRADGKQRPISATLVGWGY